MTLAQSEAVITCNAFLLDIAFENLTRSYQFRVFPGAHAQDVGYTFFNSPALGLFGQSVNETIPHLMQSFIVDFPILGNPNAAGMSSKLEIYGPENKTGIGNVRDPAASARRGFWNGMLYSADNGTGGTQIVNSNAPGMGSPNGSVVPVPFTGDADGSSR